MNGTTGEPELAEFIDRRTIKYVRIYPHPIERVWRAITDKNEVAQWFIGFAEFDVRLGGSVRWEDPHTVEGVVRQLEPPFLFEYGPLPPLDGYLRWELEATDGGTRMTFTQRFPVGFRQGPVVGDPGGDLPGGPDTPWRIGFVSGWHGFWDLLGDYLDTGNKVWPPDEEEHDPHIDEYRAHVAATIPPLSNEELGHMIDPSTFRIERLYQHPRDQVWSALTDPTEAAEWMLDEPTSTGATLIEERHDELARYRMPDGGTMQFELLSGMGATIFALSRRMPAGSSLTADTKARWHVSLDRLAWYLMDAPGFPTQAHLAAIATRY